ncbi:MAG: FG-GAP repeat protein, partial [Candidatus Cloacimonetes bacterium]|nr:FG-GAP repeat protein [Candidatus Cloacimonadota bacterium]
MLKKIVLLCLVILIRQIIHCDNYMNMMVQLEGEHDFSEFGTTMTSLDFNGDGIDDLVVGANEWDPDYNGSDPVPW